MAASIHKYYDQDLIAESSITEKEVEDPPN